MDDSAQYVILNGRLLPAEEALIPASASGLYHGTGAFETILAEKGSLFMFDEHIGRLNRGLDWLGFDPRQFMGVKKAREEVTEVLEVNRLQNANAKVRIQVSQAGGSGYGKERVKALVRLITAEPVRLRPDNPLRLKTANTRVVPSACRPSGLKLSNTLHYRHAWREAANAGFDDALMLTVGGHVAESAIANIFWKKGEIIYTPSEECDILPGIMRNAVIKAVRGMKSSELETGEFTRDDLLSADQVWLTNSVMEVQPVGMIDDIRFSSGISLIKDLRDKLKTLKEHYSL
jgi:branched-subunit amino acid aminotransferase/4-amino-4-deoxychorismate lyase